MERDIEFFEPKIKYEYVLEVFNQYKDSPEIFELLRVTKVCKGHLIGKVTRNNYEEITSIYMQNPKLFKPHILQNTINYYLGRHSGNYFSGGFVQNKLSTLQDIYLETLEILRKQRRDLSRINRTLANNYQYVDYDESNTLFYKIKELEDNWEEFVLPRLPSIKEKL